MFIELFKTLKNFNKSFKALFIVYCKRSSICFCLKIANGSKIMTVSNNCCFNLIKIIEFSVSSFYIACDIVDGDMYRE